MSPQTQSTKMRLLKLLRDSLRNQPDPSVSLSELAQTLNVSRERVRQLYRQLATEYALPPVRKRRHRFSEIEKQIKAKAVQNYSGDIVPKLRIPSPQTLVFEEEVRNYSEQRLTAPEIARRIGRPASTVYTALQRLGLPFNRAKDTGRRQKNLKTLAIEEEVRNYSEQGLSVAEIVRKTGRSESNIERIHHRLHIQLPPKQKSAQTLALEEEVRKYNEQGLSVAEIARRIGRPERTIYNALHRLRIPRKYMGAAVHSGKTANTRAFEDGVRVCSEQGMTVAEIAKRTGRPVGTIYFVLRRLHLPYTRALKRKSLETQALEAEVRSYSEGGMTPPEIAKKIGRPRSTIYSVLRRIAIPSKRVKGTRFSNPKTLAFESEVKWYYFSLGMSSKEIASITGRNRNTVSAALHRLGVHKRK